VPRRINSIIGVDITTIKPGTPKPMRLEVGATGRPRDQVVFFKGIGFGRARLWW